MTIHVMQPKSRQDRNRIYRFLYEVWSDEFSRCMDGMDHDRRIMKDTLDETAQHFIAVDDSGRILGCVRVNLLDQCPFPPFLSEHMKLDALVSVFEKQSIGYNSHFAVAPDARGKTVASLLIGALYRYCLNEGITIGICYCALQYVTFYYQLGYRPYTDNFRIDAGIRVPLVHCGRDRDYLRSIRSPLARLCPRQIDDCGEAARKMAVRFPGFRVPAFSKTNVQHLWARLAYTTPGDRNEHKHFLFDQLSEEEMKIVSTKVSEITFSEGEYVYRRGEIEPSMGALISGSLGVETIMAGTSRIVNVIQPGEPFGEIRGLGAGCRTADIVALEKSTACLMPDDFLERVARANPGLGLKLASRLLNVIASRFADMAYATAGDDTSTVKVERPLLYLQPDQNEIQNRIESYHFDSLGDQENEFKRLIAQASIGEAVEFGVLDRIGLADGMTVLDLGAGPGVTALLFAKRLKSASVIGVEPEDLLRDKASALVESQGLAGRCHFLKGTGDKIPLEDDTVDFSYARLLFQHLPNPLEVIGEMRRVTRKGGIVVVLDVDDRTNIVHPAPKDMAFFEKRIAAAQAAVGGDRHVGRKLYGYMHKAGLTNIGVEHIPITATAFGRETFFSIVYSFKRQVLERAGRFDERTEAFFSELQQLIGDPATFAMTTVFVNYGVVA